jgi:hypothetical protein
MVPVAAAICFVSSALGSVEISTSGCSVSVWLVSAPGWPVWRDCCARPEMLTSTAVPLNV